MGRVPGPPWLIITPNGAITTSPGTAPGTTRYTGTGSAGTNSNGWVSIEWPAGQFPNQFPVSIDASQGGGITPFTYTKIRKPVEAWVDVTDPAAPAVYVDPVTGLEVPATDVVCVVEQCEPAPVEKVCPPTTPTGSLQGGK